MARHRCSLQEQCWASRTCLPSSMRDISCGSQAPRLYCTWRANLHLYQPQTGAPPFLLCFRVLVSFLVFVFVDFVSLLTSCLCWLRVHFVSLLNSYNKVFFMLFVVTSFPISTKKGPLPSAPPHQRHPLTVLHVDLYTYTHTHVYIYIYIYMYI